MRRPRESRPSIPLRVVLLALVLLLPAAARAACHGAIADLLRPRLVPASLTADASPSVRLTFLGHASFLIESPDGVTAVTDYNGFIRPPFTPDIVTMNVAHSTHYTDQPDPGIKWVLRGWDPAGGVPSHDIRERDMHVFNVPTNIRDWSGGTRFAGNSMFAFDVADLCIVHLGHLHHTLTPEHLAALGQVDVLLVPVDGAYTMSTDDMMEVVDAIHAPLLIPMHFFGPTTLNRFLDQLAPRYAVRRSAGPSVELTRESLPGRREALVLAGY
jgi:L-ascorbate metabolism protein UlaG (beta-lactamase superfamily)